MRPLMRVLALVVLVLLGACTTSSGPAERDGATPALEQSTWSGPRPAYHLTPEQRWMNDPQRPFFLDGRWHLYYLYNADHPEGNGTSWYHATSTDLVHWRDEGVAIEKYTNGLGDIQSGSAVVDTDGTAGFGAGAVIALVTQQDAGVQRQSLFYSTDGGHTFTPFDGNPVMDNPGAEHWRDPKVVWDDRAGRWVMVLAEGHKLGFYTSPDLRTWTYRSDLARDDLGLLECPELFEMAVDGDPDRTSWVLATSANGAEHGRTTGVAYWTGSWDGTSFTADHAEPLWLDSGTDFYAATTWEDSRREPADRLSQRYAIGWLNNWEYAGALPSHGWAGGMQSVVREITLSSEGDRVALHSRPVTELDRLEGQQIDIGSPTLGSGAPRTIDPGTSAYRLRLTVARGDATGQLRVRLSGGVELGVDPRAGVVQLSRRRDVDGTPPGYDRQSTHLAADGDITLDVLVDVGSVEAFVDDGRASFSARALDDGAPDAVRLEVLGGEVPLADVSVTPLSPAPPARR